MEVNMEELKEYTQQVWEAVDSLLSVADLKPGQIVVVGCSTSEVIGKKIGTATNIDVAKAIIAGILPLLNKRGIFLAVQCCEHLNRALVVEEECAEKYGLEIVNVVPHEKAGGALATVAMDMFAKPVVVESILAHAGLDIGDTLIGMHLKRVAVPVRTDIKNIGKAHLTMARTRPKLIGGERARYR
jgi:uncharacterized protein (TIGR01440 family)